MASEICRVTFLSTVRPRGMTVTDLVDAEGKPGVKRARLRWTPDEEQYGQEHLFCFVAVDEDG